MGSRSPSVVPIARRVQEDCCHLRVRRDSTGLALGESTAIGTLAAPLPKYRIPYTPRPVTRTRLTGRAELNVHAEGGTMRARTLFVSSLLAAAVVALGCGGRLAYNLPPAQQLMHPGPGVGGPGPGVLSARGQTMQSPAPEAFGPGGTQQVSYEVDQVQYCEPGAIAQGGPASSQIAFVGEDGLLITWDVASHGMFDSAPLAVPGRQDFSQGAIYRLRLQEIPGRPGVTLYPTLEVAPVTPRTDAYLAHAPVPVQFSEEDFDQVLSGNFVTKVVYLPDPEFQELALSGVETLVSTRLDPGADPVAEADRRGSILAILRMGSKDLGSTMGGMYDGVVPAQYGDDCETCDPYGDAYRYQGTYSEKPLGMATSGFAPGPVPPHMLAGLQPQYGMPHTGTPIGLPGPPHIPLGAPAGLQSHKMKNRTRVVLPPPTNQVRMTVKQRPGMNYPRPVNSVHVNEVHRAPLRPLGGALVK